MATCEVLRCDQPGAGIVNYGAPDGPALEGVVCQGHHAWMTAGEQWAHEDDGVETQGSAFLMGDDLAALELTTLTGVPAGSRR